MVQLFHSQLFQSLFRQSNNKKLRITLDYPTLLGLVIEPNLTGVADVYQNSI